jgi:hypothetical protein
VLVVRKAQLWAFESKADEEYCSHLASHLRTHFPEQFARKSEEELRAFALHSIVKARRYGLSTKRDFCHFLNLAAAYGLDFDSQPERGWMRLRLEDQSVTSPADRLALLTGECLSRQRIEDANRERRRRFLEKA